MNPDQLYARYQELQQYVGWAAEDGQRIHAVADLLEPALPALVDDFYATIEAHPDARKVITGGAAQVERLKGKLIHWLQQLLRGPYDRDYAVGRWKVGYRHVEIGLDQAFTNVALSRLRSGLARELESRWTGPPQQLFLTLRSLNALMDLDLAKIQDAYAAEYLARLQRSELLAAIGQVAGGIAHELRNPLNVVKTSVYYLRNARNSTPEKRAEHLERIERHVLQADAVITTLSNFAKMPVPNLLPVPLRPLLAEVLEVCALPKNVQSAVDCPPELSAALADADQLRIVLSNLVRNAREAMPEGGRLTLAARAVGDGVDISVSDTGVGIAPEHLSRVMEPLFTTKAKGLGLGLALARAILEKNQGSLRVTSQLGQGSTFTVRLHAAPDKKDEPRG